MTREKTTLWPLRHKALRRSLQSDVHVLRVFIRPERALTQRCGHNCRRVQKEKENDQLGIDGDTRKRVCGGSLTQVSPAKAANRSATWGNLARTQHSVIPMHRYQLSRRKRKSNRVVGTGTSDKNEVTGFTTCYFQNCHHLAGGGKGCCASFLCSSNCNDCLRLSI